MKENTHAAAVSTATGSPTLVLSLEERMESFGGRGCYAECVSHSRGSSENCLLGRSGVRADTFRSNVLEVSTFQFCHKFQNNVFAWKL